MPHLENRFYCHNCQNCPERDKPVAVPLPQVSRSTKVPLLTIQDLQQNNVVQNPLTCGDVAFLYQYGRLLEAYDGDYKPPGQNSRTLQHWFLKEDYQRWIYEHYIFNESDEKIWVKAVAREASAMFRLPNNMALHDEIHIIRIHVYNDRRKARQSRRPVEEVAKERFAQLEIEFDNDQL